MSRGFRASSWRVTAQVLLWRHGWAWPFALLLVPVTAVLYLGLLQPARAALAVTQAQWARELASASAKTLVNEPAPETQRLASLRAILNSSPDPAELVQRMAALAEAAQIALPQGEYQQQVHGATQVVQVRVTQAVRASYPQLRRYIEAVLGTIPNASLDHVAVRRDNVGQSQLEVRLRWSLWMQGPPAGATPPDAPLGLVPREQLVAAAGGGLGARTAARDLFSTHSWAPPPHPVPESPPAPAAAPPMPYTFLGKKQDGEAWEVYLGRGEQTFIVRVGQAIETDWRIDRIAPPTLAATYLPLGLPQTLPIGGLR